MSERDDTYTITADVAGIIDNYLNADERAEGKPERFLFIVAVARIDEERTVVCSNIADPEVVREKLADLGGKMPSKVDEIKFGAAQ